jgi:hypothetical protein
MYQICGKLMLFIQILFFICFACTIASLFFGLYTLSQSNDIQQKYSNAAMRWRITFQGLTLVLFLLMLWLKR